MRERILVVDDEARNRALVRAVLGKSYDVVEAGDAYEAYNVLDNDDIDLVLLDVMMPGTSGVAALPEIKKRSARHGYLPILMLTALAEQDDRNAALLAGADDFLIKPFNQRELLLRVQAFLRLRAQDLTIRRQRDDLEKVIALKDDLFGLLVHDLRNPLTSVIAMLTMLKDEATSPQAVEDAVAGLVAARRVGDVIEDILQLIALEAGQIQLLWSQVQMATICSEAVDTLKGAARDRHIALNVQGDASARVDRQLLRRALENLIANAVRHAPRDSAIDVVIADKPDNILICVNDRGPGVPEDRKRSLFSKFGIAKSVEQNTRRSYGFGLYLVDLVARAHHGSTNVVDRDGGGASFQLALPRQQPSLAA
ncbi:MAG TPA: response regulator [Myxococcota bacterium]